jgi:hypothetical protein
MSERRHGEHIKSPFLRRMTYAFPFTLLVLCSSNMDGDDHLWKPDYRQSYGPDQQIGELEDPESRPRLKRKTGSDNLKHVCARCGKSRSRRYRPDRPLVPGVQPISDICSRPECAEYASKKNARYASKKDAGDVSKKPQPQVIVLEFHHYLHTGTAGNGPSSSIATAVELSGEEKTSRKGLPGEYPYTSSCGWKLFHTLAEQPPPRVNLRSKPMLVYC